MPVYFAYSEEAGLVKIGYSADVEKRIYFLKNRDASDVILLRHVEGMRPAEQWMHERFSDLRVRGEWFKFSDEMMTVETPDHLKEKPVQMSEVRVRVTEEEETEIRAAAKQAGFRYPAEFLRVSGLAAARKDAKS